MEKFTRDLLSKVGRLRRFPHNTCPASRHTQMIAEALAKGKPYPMLQEEPEHCAGSILSVLASLYRARTQLAKLTRKPTPPRRHKEA